MQFFDTSLGGSASLCPLINHQLLFLNGKFLITFGSGKDGTLRQPPLGVKDRKFCKHGGELLFGAADRQCEEDAKCREDVYFFLCIEM